MTDTTKTKPCPNGCDHTDSEHKAFDDGVEAGRRGVEKCPYIGPLAEDWWTGHSVGAMDRKPSALNPKAAWPFPEKKK